MVSNSMHGMCGVCIFSTAVYHAIHINNSISFLIFFLQVGRYIDRRTGAPMHLHTKRKIPFCLSACICLLVCLPLYLPACMSASESACLSMFACLSVWFYICLPVCLPISISIFCLSTYIYLSVCLSASHYICLSIYLSIYLSDC